MVHFANMLQHYCCYLEDTTLSSSLATFSEPQRPCEAQVGVSGVSARGHRSPVLGQHRQPLQQDGHHRLVQVRSGGQRLQVHLLLGHLLRVGLLVLHRPLEAAGSSSSSAWWECLSLHCVCKCVCVCVLSYLQVLCQAELCVRVFRHLRKSQRVGSHLLPSFTCSFNSCGPAHSPSPGRYITHSCACLHRLLSISVIWETDRQTDSLKQSKLWPAGLIWPAL